MEVIIQYDGPLGGDRLTLIPITQWVVTNIDNRGPVCVSSVTVSNVGDMSVLANCHTTLDWPMAGAGLIT